MKLKSAAACLPGIKMEKYPRVQTFISRDLKTCLLGSTSVPNEEHVSIRAGVRDARSFPAISILASLEPVLCLVTREIL